MKKIIVTAFLAAVSFGASADLTSICTGATPGAAGTAPDQRNRWNTLHGDSYCAEVFC